MIKKVIKLAVFLLVANAVYQVGPVTVHYFQFKDAVEELALFSEKATEQQLAERVMALAEEYSIPLEREYLLVKRTSDSLSITADYLETLVFFPGTEYSWEFNVDARAFR